jgi:cation diffusion facilitator CzcD-associated flavoprotein CzcO
MSASPPSAPAARFDSFAGSVVHDGRTLDVRGKRVAVVGDPRRVVRAVPRLAGHASTLKVFQTEGVWVLPFDGRLGRAIDAIAGPVPRPLRWRVVTACATGNLRRSVPDGWTRRHLGPQVAASPATTIRSSHYYRALRRRDVALIGWPIASVVAGGIRTADGIEHHVDVIVVA